MLRKDTPGIQSAKSTSVSPEKPVAFFTVHASDKSTSVSPEKHVVFFLYMFLFVTKWINLVGFLPLQAIVQPDFL